MVTAIILLVVFGLMLLVGKLLNNNIGAVAPAGNIAMCVMLVFTGMSHFYFTRGMALMMPDFLPAKVFLVYATGVLEILLGLGLCFARTRKVSSKLLILLFILFLPANITAALKQVNMQTADFTGPGLSYLWFRIPLQLFYIAWVYFFGLRPKGAVALTPVAGNERLPATEF